MAEEAKTLITDDMSYLIIEAAEKIAMTSGAHTVTVRKILQTLSITNRVFYNRFHNINEVLDIVYKNTVQKIRESIKTEFDGKTDFFDYVIDLVAKSLIISYDTKMKFNQYIFESDSASRSNYEWWTAEIKKLIEYAKSHEYIKDVDTDTMSYSIWCFCRGYNADAVSRDIPREKAIERFKYSFKILLDGMKK